MLVRVRGNTDVERRALERRRAFDAAVAAIVREAQAAGDFRASLDPAVFVRLVFGMSNSLVEWYRPDGALPAGAIAASVVQLVFDGACANG